MKIVKKIKILKKFSAKNEVIARALIAIFSQNDPVIVSYEK